MVLDFFRKQSCETQGDHSPDNVTVHGTPAHVKCYSYHDGTSVIVSVGPVGMQQRRSQIQNEMHKLSKVKNGCKYAAYNKQF